MREMLSSRARWRGVLAAVVFVVAGLDLTAVSRTALIHVDEAWMLNRGVLAGPLYRDYLRTGVVSPEWDGAVWQPRKPPLGNVVVGAGLWMAGLTPPARIYEYDWRHDYHWNIEHRDQLNVPSIEVLRAGRSLVPWFSAAGTTAIFLLAAGAAGIAGGLASAAVFQLNPVVRLHGSHALSDMVMMSLVLWALWYLARRVAPAWDGTRARLVWRCAVFAVLTGLAAATKQNGALVGCTAAVLFAIWALASVRRLGREALIRGALATTVLAVCAYGTYVAVNPQLHPAPLARTLAQVQAWSTKFDEHQGRRTHQALTTIAARARGIGAVMRGRDYATLPFPYLTTALTAAGTLLLVLAPRPLPEGRSLPTLLLVWSAVTVGVMLLWIPLHWDRYYLPVIAVGSVLIGGNGRLIALAIERGDPRELGIRCRDEGGISQSGDRGA